MDILSVIDDVDYAMMLHEVYFEGTEKEHEANVEDMWIAWVIRRLENKGIFMRTQAQLSESNSNSTMIPTMPTAVFTWRAVKSGFHVKVVM